MKEELRILILEDSEEDAGLIDRTLNKEKVAFTRLRVETREEFVAALGEFDPDIILSDHALPQFNSIKALEICRQLKAEMPFILVTGAVSEEFAVNCLKRGADDYILKSNLSRLPMAIEHSIRQHQYECDRIKNEDMLLHKNDELTKINKELDSFVYSISHNLRSPLSSVLGLVNISRLDQNKSEETTAQYFSMIETSVLKLDKTLQEILDYSQNARTDLENVEISPDKFINKCIEQLKYLPGYSEIVKEVEIINDVPLHCDPHRLGIVLDILISNAIRYRDFSKGRQFVKIIVKVEKAFATFTVRDNGIGIAEEYLSRVFSMFYRATERSDGAGLGLYIAKEMIAKLNGTITIESKPLVETLVTFSVPNHGLLFLE
ncbi:MAG TPA: hybrid sensor histidine kinase/response regulator [Chryseolinea sp.]|nr:hybrid sensor histidine kinase/response regulator [Chryseolinea sp.]